MQEGAQIAVSPMPVRVVVIPAGQHVAVHLAAMPLGSGHSNMLPYMKQLPVVPVGKSAGTKPVRRLLLTHMNLTLVILDHETGKSPVRALFCRKSSIISVKMAHEGESVPESPLSCR